MQFLIIAQDQIEEGPKRRLAAREEHIKLGDELKASGHFLYGVATLSPDGDMIGSVMVMDFPSRNELDEWLMVEPYVVHKVWDKIEIIPCKVGPTFLK